eukprot:6200187-Pleurochrysis_carterae.AAC.1
MRNPIDLSSDVSAKFPSLASDVSRNLPSAPPAPVARSEDEIMLKSALADGAPVSSLGSRERVRARASKLVRAEQEAEQVARLQQQLELEQARSQLVRTVDDCRRPGELRLNALLAVLRRRRGSHLRVLSSFSCRSWGEIVAEPDGPGRARCLCKRTGSAWMMPLSCMFECMFGLLHVRTHNAPQLCC